MASIKIRVGEDGTYTLIRDGVAVSSGLTRPQAERLAAVMRWIDPVVPQAGRSPRREAYAAR